MANFRQMWNGRTSLFNTPGAKRRALIWGAGATTGLIVLIIIIVVATTGGPTKTSIGRDALRNAPLIDGHNDLPMNLREILKNDISKFKFEDLTKMSENEWNCESCATDLKKLKKGMVGGQFWSAYVNCNHKDPVQETLEQIDVIRRLIRKYSSDLELVTSADDIMRVFQESKIASMIGVEGGHSIDSRLGVLRMFYQLGVRYMTLTHWCDTPWASSSTSDDKEVFTKNLTDFGKSVVLEMNRIGMMVDLSHVSEAVMNDVLEISKAPVIFSHSSSRAICNHTRNVHDYVLKKLKDNGGIIMVNFYAGFLCNGTLPNGTSTWPKLQKVMEHINHIADVIGVDHVGIGADFDGMSDPPVGLEDVSKYPLLFDLLYNNDSSRWSIANLEKLAGRNLLRVFKKVEDVRNKLSSEEAQQKWISKKELSKEDQVCRTETDVEENIDEITTLAA